MTEVDGGRVSKEGLKRGSMAWNRSLPNVMIRPSRSSKCWNRSLWRTKLFILCVNSTGTSLNNEFTILGGEVGVGEQG